MKDSNFVFAARRDRLGARLGNLISAWEFAQKTGRTLILNWEDYADLQPGSFSFFDFFENLDEMSEELGVIIDTGTRKEFFNELEKHNVSSVENHLNQSIDHFKAIDAAVLFNRTTQYKFRDEVTENSNFRAELFQRLPLNTKISSTLDRIFENENLSDSVSVHVRMGDIVELLSNIPEAEPESKKRSQVASFASRFAPQQAYMSAVEAFPSSTVFVFSDSDIARSAFRDRFGSRIVDIRQDLDKLALSDAQVAFCEMQIIMRTSEIICARSAFSNLACHLSTCKMHSIFPYVDSGDLWSSILKQIDGRQDHPELVGLLLDYYRRLIPDKITQLRELAGEHS